MRKRRLSDWDSSLEAQRESAGGLACKLGPRLVSGLLEAAAKAILMARQARNGAPFASVEEAAWQAGVGPRALVALAGTDAFASSGTSRRMAGWDARTVACKPEALPLFAAASAAAMPVGDLHARLKILERHAADLMSLQLSAQELVLGNWLEFTGLSRTIMIKAVAAESFGG